ncbi:MAG: flippase [Patescibacteria group bacterium]
MQRETVTRNTAYLTASYVGQKILSFFYFVMVARFIGVEDLGKYTFAFAFTTLFAVCVDLGFTSALIRESVRFIDKSSQYLSNVLWVKLGLGIIMYGVIVVLVNVMGYPEITKQLVYISGVNMIFDQLSLTFWGLFRSHQNLKIESISVVINQAIIVVVGLIVLFLKLPLVYLMLPFFCASAFSLIYSGWSVRTKLRVKYWPTFDKEIIIFLLKLAAPFALVAIFSRVYGHIDSIMLSKLAGDKAVGWYSVAMKIPVALQFIPAALAAAIFPAFSKHFVNDKIQLKQTFDRVMKFLMMAVIPLSIGGALLARPVILFFYGQAFAPAILPLQILMLGLTFIFLNFPLGSLLNSCNRQVANTILVGATMLMNIALNVWLIPKYSFVGAATAFLFSHTFLFIAGMIVASRIIPYGKMSLIIDTFKSFISVTAMGFAIYFLRNLHFLFLIAIGVFVYFIVMFILRGLRMSDIEFFYQSIFKNNIHEKNIVGDN